MSEGEIEIPADPFQAFAFLVSKCASGCMAELIELGKTETEARNAIVNQFLHFAAGEACRIARQEGREPNPDKWRAATSRAFDRAVKRTAEQAEKPAAPSGFSKDSPVTKTAQEKDNLAIPAAPHGVSR